MLMFTNAPCSQLAAFTQQGATLASRYRSVPTWQNSHTRKCDRGNHGETRCARWPNRRLPSSSGPDPQRRDNEGERERQLTSTFEVPFSSKRDRHVHTTERDWPVILGSVRYDITPRTGSWSNLVKPWSLTLLMRETGQQADKPDRSRPLWAVILSSGRPPLNHRS